MQRNAAQYNTVYRRRANQVRIDQVVPVRGTYAMQCSTVQYTLYTRAYTMQCNTIQYSVIDPYRNLFVSLLEIMKHQTVHVQNI